jgi:hypothetical protein
MLEDESAPLFGGPYAVGYASSCKKPFTLLVGKVTVISKPAAAI